MGFFTPSRALRRKVAGHPCNLCGLRLHHLDVLGYVDDRILDGDHPVYYCHAGCVAVTLEDSDAAPEEDGAASHEGEPAGSTPDLTVYTTEETA